MKILIMTDNHVGFLEQDPVRGHDSFESFEECFELARHFDVDMVINGGDIFHENKPSRSTLFRCDNAHPPCVCVCCRVGDMVYHVGRLGTLQDDGNHAKGCDGGPSCSAAAPQ